MKKISKSLAYDVLVDATGLICPLPILRARKALARMDNGKILCIITTDENASRDFQFFTENTDNDLLEQKIFGTKTIHFLKRGS